MSLKETNITDYLTELKDMYRNSHLPVCLLDARLQVIWSTDEVQTTYPGVLQPECMQSILEGYTVDTVLKRIQDKGHFEVCGNVEHLFSSQGLIIFQAPAPEPVYVMHLRTPDNTDSTLKPIGYAKRIASFESGMRRKLMGIFSSLNLLDDVTEESVWADPMFFTYTDQIRHHAMEIYRTIEIVTDYMRLTNGLYEHHMERITLLSMLREVIGEVQRLVGSEDLKFTCDFPKSEIPFFTEKRPLLACLLQLISNSCTFTRPGNEIILRVRQHGDELEFLLIDHGIGIPSFAMPHIMQPFYSRNPDGDPFARLGLGLTVANLLATFLGGSLNLVSCENEGTTARLVIPVKDMDEEINSVSAPGPEERAELRSYIRMMLAESIPVQAQEVD